MRLVCAIRAKPTPNLPSLSRMRYFGPTPQAVVLSHVLDQRDDLCGYLWFGRSCPGLVLPVQLKPLAMPPQKRLGLNDEKRLLPGPYCSCQKDQEHPVGLLEDWSFDVSTEDDQLLSEEGVFCHEFRVLATWDIRSRN